jgi:hypothetical protein
MIFSTFLQNYAKSYKVTHLRDFWHFLNQNKKSNYSAVLPLVALFCPERFTPSKQKSDLPKQTALSMEDIYEYETRYFVNVREAASVFLPHEPSTAIPAAFWKLRTASSVASPYFPLTDMLRPKAQFKKR